MPSWWMRYRRWQERLGARLGARPGESREHAEMRVDRNHRKQLRKLRRQKLAPFQTWTNGPVETVAAANVELDA